MGFPGGSVVKNLPASAGDRSSVPPLGRSPREGNSNPLLYSCLGNPMDIGAWQATVHGVAKEWNMTEQLNKYGFYGKWRLPPHIWGIPIIWVLVRSKEYHLMSCWKKSPFQVLELKLGDWKTCRPLGHYSFLLLLSAFSVVQLLSPVQLFVTPQTAAHQASLSFTISQSLLKLMSTESVMPSHPLLPPSPPAFTLSQHQGLFQWVSSSNQVARVLELQQQSFWWIFRTDIL